MKTLPPNPTASRREASSHSRHALAWCLIFAGLVFAASAIKGNLNHPPFVGWLADQAVYGPSFATQYIRIEDYDGNPFTFVKVSSNPNFYSGNNVHVDLCTTQSEFDAGCPDDGHGYKVSFYPDPDPMSPPPHVATITLKAKENGAAGLTGLTSFTLRLNDPFVNINPPSIQNLPNRALPIGEGNVASYKTEFVVGDLDEDGNEDVCLDESQDATCPSTLTPSATSDNQILLLDSGIHIDLMSPNADLLDLELPRHYLLTATTQPNQVGTATVTVNLTDNQNNVTSTSFVLRVFPSSDAEPSISNTSQSYEEQVLPATSVTHQFTVASGDSTLKQELWVSGSSSNTRLIPNSVDNIQISQPISTGAGSVKIIPASALPTPSPSPGGVPQASTITLTVTDGSYRRQTTFLYVLAPPTGSPTTSYSRPSGVYPTTQPADLSRYPFLTGSMYNLQWDKAEPVEGQPYDWEATINPILRDLPALIDLSLGLQKEPCYIADDAHAPPVREFNTWCDTKMGDQPMNSCTVKRCGDSDAGFTRAVPWDHFLRRKRDDFLAGLAKDLTDTGLMAKVTIINTYLPGGEGIRNVKLNFDGDCLTHPDNCMDGYTRERLLWAIQDELRTVQDKFPGKLVQIGFFEPTDFLDASHNNSPLWKWLYRDATTDANALDENGVHMVSLFDEFNGIRRPRVSFWQDNLAATRTSVPSAIPPVSASNAPNYITPPKTAAYTITPVSSFLPSFDYYGGALTTATYNNGIAFEANTIWSNPFKEDNGRKLINTINGSPNDGLEGAFNAYLSQYLEVYVQDIDAAVPLGGTQPTLNAELWKGQLQSWHDYAKHLRSDVTPLEAPAGLTVERTSATNNLVKWYAVYGPATTTYTLQKRTLGTPPSPWINVAGCVPAATQCMDGGSTGSQYAYQVRATNGAINSPWSTVAVFLSIGSDDGFITKNGAGNIQPMPTASPQPAIRVGRGSTSNVELRGFLSFDTSALAGTTVLGAKLRLYQTTDNTVYDLLKPSVIDIKKGFFGNSTTLEANDFEIAASNHDNALQVQPLGAIPNWVIAELSPLYVTDINNSTNNMGRTQFRLKFAGTTATQQVKWNSGESVGGTPDAPPQLIVQYTQ